MLHNYSFTISQAGCLLCRHRLGGAWLVPGAWRHPGVKLRHASAQLPNDFLFLIQVYDSDQARDFSHE